MENHKFEFGTDWQLDLLNYTCVDRDGYKALQLYDDSYFTLLEHAVIAHGLKSFYDRKGRVPGSTSLKEELRHLLNSREYVNTLSKDDEKEIVNLVNKIYSGPPKDGDDILEKCVEFARFVGLKQTIENIDLQDFRQYEGFSRKVQTAISLGSKEQDNPGSFLIQDIKERQFKRQDFNPVSPTFPPN